MRSCSTPAMMRSAQLALLALAPSVVSAITTGFPYGSTTVRGVNLGGWLVLEPWITPSIFDNTGDSRVVDEYTYGQFVARATATSVLNNHWNTFITEQDFIAIKNAGLNHVRLPIGYWAWDVSGGEPYVQGQLPFLAKAITWAQNQGLKIVLDLHGAPGSQNGFDNSGQKGTPRWQTSQSNIDRTNAIIKKIALQYASQSSVIPIIATLNEPAGFFSQQLLDVTRQYWYDSYGNVRFPFGNSTQGNTVLMIHDAFQPLSYWNGFMGTSTGRQGVAIDTHIYQMFSNALVAMNNSQHISNACNNAGELSAFNDLWKIVGEWTTAATDCAKYLNGRGTGARYDGTLSGSPRVGSCTGLTGSTSTFSSAYKTFLRQMFEAQTITFERNANGWIYWTWKTEITDEWSYQKGLAGGWIPSNPGTRQFPTICG
ncbi:exo-beta-1,3-glucanase [Exidia glandulosa HHB12029]|uniref:glucan 1,3-beta-glucosidase n=1 Tax=Exidia glandulosa HHB12029 TaxID=1314781 RepID=A0A165NMM6_EXIGL|nr:exo-beta-1,3-glucanase [Exidia glandulosa HHB12029]